MHASRRKVANLHFSVFRSIRHDRISLSLSLSHHTAVLGGLGLCTEEFVLPLIMRDFLNLRGSYKAGIPTTTVRIVSTVLSTVPVILVAMFSTTTAVPVPTRYLRTYRYR